MLYHYQHLQNDPFSKDPSMQSGVDSLLEFWKHHLGRKFTVLTITSFCIIQKEKKVNKCEKNHVIVFAARWRRLLL